MKYVISIFLGMYLFGTFIEGLSKVKNIGLYGAILFFVIQLLRDRENSYKLYYQNNKLLLNSFFIFLFVVFLSVIFAYSDFQPSLREFRVQFLNIGIFMLISLYITDKNFLFKVFFYSIIFAFIFNTLRYGYNYYLSSHFDFSIRLERNYSDYFEILYPFILMSLFIVKSKFKYLIGIVLIFGFFELLLTGARGAWISVTGESVLILFLIIFIKKEYIKKILIVSSIGFFLIISGTIYMYQHSNLIKDKIKSGIQPAGRDIIIKTRLPIFMKYENWLIGVGGPENYQYNKFLNHYHAPKVYGIQNGNQFEYHSEEPIFLAIFYREGILGILTFSLFTMLFLYYMFRFIKNEEYIFENKLFILGIMSSFIGYYLIRGLVEGRSFKYILIYLSLYLITKENNKND